ncbi:hypothetical protein PCE31107_02727 [Pandoraea cepalis]|uniref:Uncharacterized protein n=1 Tax=Pandoraea cepalis TaxID=2508294 RepID=A0A5E4VLT2_9BURK|nr:hypothetical protein PCE31107_02727 [Pandoraea cepalis]
MSQSLGCCNPRSCSTLGLGAPRRKAMNCMCRRRSFIYANAHTEPDETIAHRYEKRKCPSRAIATGFFAYS